MVLYRMQPGWVILLLTRYWNSSPDYWMVQAISPKGFDVDKGKIRCSDELNNLNIGEMMNRTR